MSTFERSSPPAPTVKRPKFFVVAEYLLAWLLASMVAFLIWLAFLAIAKSISGQESQVRELLWWSSAMALLFGAGFANMLRDALIEPWYRSDYKTIAIDYMRQHGQGHLRDEHWTMVTTDAEKYFDGTPSRLWLLELWGEIVGNVPLPGYCEVVVRIRESGFSTLVVRLLIEVEKSWTVERTVLAGPWYLDGELQTNAARSVTIQHRSRFAKNKILQYLALTMLNDSKRWLARDHYHASREGDVIDIVVVHGITMPDHFLTLSIRDESSDWMIFDQVWNETYDSRVRVELQESAEGTLITVTLSGIIPPKLERAFREDWSFAGIA